MLLVAQCTISLPWSTAAADGPVDNLSWEQEPGLAADFLVTTALSVCLGRNLEQLSCKNICCIYKPALMLEEVFEKLYMPFIDEVWCLSNRPYTLCIIIINIMYHLKMLNIIPQHVYLRTVTGIKVIDRMAGDGKNIIFPLLLKIQGLVWLGYYPLSEKQFVRVTEVITGNFLIITIIVIWLFCAIAQLHRFFFWIIRCWFSGRRFWPDWL